MILHIPHAKTAIPENERGEFIISDLNEELQKMTDWGADSLFTVGERIEFKYSRLLCDVERFAHGDDMEKIGMGVCYTRTSDGRRLRFVSDRRRDELMQRYYYPHHLKLEKAVERELASNGRSLIIDCHSFPASPLPYENDMLRPDFCIGFDPRCSENGYAMADGFRKMGYAVAVNRPFAGALMPIRYLQDPRVTSVMIEVNRSLIHVPSTAANISEILTSVQH